MLALVPFGGVKTFVKAAEVGMFNSVDEPSFWFYFVNRGLTYIYFSCLLCGMLLPLAYKMNSKLKYKLEVIVGSTALVILLLGGRFLMLIFG